MERPEVSALTESLYASLGWQTAKDEENDWALLQLCATWVEVLLDPVYEVAKEGDNGEPPWSRLFDPDECPARVLPYLAQYVGVVITPDMDEAQIRTEIREPTGWARGRGPAIRLAAQRTLIGEDPLVIIHPRTPEVGHHYVRTLASETPDEARTEAALREALPAWEVLDYEAIEGVTWADLAASPNWETFADLATAFTDFNDLAAILPSEL